MELRKQQKNLHTFDTVSTKYGVNAAIESTQTESAGLPTHTKSAIPPRFFAVQ
jgi:hypothetical protein